MATLNFTRQGEIYVAETIVTGDYLLHLERTNSGWLKMYQCSTSDGQFAPCFMPNNPFVAGEIYDWAYSHGYDENAPKGQCTIDRIDVNGNYEPSNCRWVSVDIQANNTTKTKYITYRGETLSLGETANKYHISRIVLWKRLRRGWDVETAIETPVSNSNKYITIQKKKEGK